MSRDRERRQGLLARPQVNLPRQCGDPYPHMTGLSCILGANHVDSSGASTKHAATYHPNGGVRGGSVPIWNVVRW